MVQAIMRKHQRWIWTAIAVVVVITFVFWGAFTGTGSREAGSPGKLYGKSVSVETYLNARRAIWAYYRIFAGQEIDRTEQGKQMLEQQTWVRLIEQRKLDEWNIAATDDEVVKFIRTRFTENGQFIPARFDEFVRITLPQLNIKEADFDKIVREQIRLDKLHRIIGATAVVVPSEVRERFNLMNEKLDISVVTYDAASFTNQVKLTDAEIKEYFEKNKEPFRIPEHRRVRYVRFANVAYTNQVTVSDVEAQDVYEKNKMMFMDEKGKPRPFEAVKSDIRERLLQGKAFQRASEIGNEMAIKLVPPKDASHKEVDLTQVDFDAVAKKFNATPQDTDFFELRKPVTGIKAGPYFNQEAFKLTPKEPFSDAVSGDDGVYVLKYLDVKASELPTLEAARDKVVELMTLERALEMARNKGREQARIVKNAVFAAVALNVTNQASAVSAQAEKVFTEQTQKLGLKVLNPHPFSLQDVEETNVPDARTILNIAFAMHEGEASDFIDTGRGGLFLLLKKRIEPTDAEYAKERPQFEPRFVATRRDLALNDWLGQQVQVAKPTFLAERQQPAPPGQRQTGGRRPSPPPPSM